MSGDQAPSLRCSATTDGHEAGQVGLNAECGPIRRGSRQPNAAPSWADEHDAPPAITSGLDQHWNKCQSGQLA